MKHTILLTAAAVAALTLSGCGATPAAKSSAKTSKSASAAPSTTTSPLDDSLTNDEAADEAADEPTAEDSDPGPAHFGEGFTYADGLEVKVSKLKPYHPDEYAVKRKGDKHFVVFTITIKNGTGKMFDPSMVSTSATTGEREAEDVFDDHVGGSPDTKILPGHVQKWPVAYGVVPHKDLVLQVEPGYNEDDEGYDTILFTS